MKNIFIAPMALGNPDQMVHYQHTIVNRVSQEILEKHLDKDLMRGLRELFGPQPIAVWGSNASEANRSKFVKMRPGDDILVLEGTNVKMVGKIAGRTENEALSRELWKGVSGKTKESWNLIYFIANTSQIDLPFIQFCDLIGYKPKYRPQGFTIVSEEFSTKFYSRYEDLTSVLERLQRHQRPVQRTLPDEARPDERLEPVLPIEEPDFQLTGDELSEHVRKQWQLLKFGRGAGTGVWIPKSDQSKITGEFGFKDFPQHFTVGIDIPARYVENIDVVWKEQYKIHAAFEIEHSTAIYSGILRLSDLNQVAPNSAFKLIIVAPSEKRARVIDQIERPTFKNLHLDQQVRFLPYEEIDEIDRFVEKHPTGYTMDLLLGRSEALVSA